MSKYVPRDGIAALNPTFWTPFLQVPLYKSLVATEVANTRLEPYLRKGDKITHNSIAMPNAVDYVPPTGNPSKPGGIAEFALVNATPEYLTIDECKVVPYYVDQIEELQANVALAPEMGERAGYKLADIIDTAVLANVVKGTPFSFGELTKDNVIKFMTSSRKKLRELNVEERGDWIMVVDPYGAEMIELVFTDKEVNSADATLRNGFIGSALGYKIYISNNLPTDEYGNTCYYVGRAKQIDLVMQAAPTMAISDAENAIGKKFKPHTLFGTDVFTEGKSRFLCATVTQSS